MALPSPPDSRTLHLRKLLAAALPTTPAEQAFLDRMRELLDAGSTAFDRTSYEPGHFTASAFVVDGRHENLLLIHHKKLRRWLQPGGHVETIDPDLEHAARREVREETGLSDLHPLVDGAFDLDVHEIPPFGAARAHSHFDVRFLFRAHGERLAPSAEVTSARWMPLAKLRELTDDDSVLRAVGKLELHLG
jgi:ADP-ribose pyrophosphatase YjhB (NUDIX family)